MLTKFKFNKNSLFVKYSLLFFATYLVVFLPVSIKNMNIGFTGLYEDSMYQHLLFFKEFITEIKDFIFRGETFSLYDMNIGYGADVINSYSYYSLFDPFNIIAIVLPIKFIEFSYYFIFTIKMFLSGYFFCILSKKMGIKNSKVLLVTGIFYAINSSALSFTFKHPIFESSVMILPLLILGIEKAIRGESKILLVVSTAFCVLSQFYMGAYVIFSAELYLMFRLCRDKTTIKKWFIDMIRYNMFILLGIMISSIVLLTQFFALIGNGRTNGNVMLTYSFEYFTGLIYTFLVPTPSFPSTNGIGNVVVTFLVLMFIFYYKKEKWLKRIIVLEFCFLLIPYVGYALSLFSYVNNRWIFTMALPLTMAAAISLDNFETYDKQKHYIVIKGIVFACVFGGMLGSIYLINNFLYLNLIWTILIYIIDLGIFALLFFYINKIKFEKIKIEFKDFPKVFMLVQTLFMFVFSIGMCFYLTEDYEFEEYYQNEFDNSWVADDGFYRVSKSSYVMNQYAYVNDSIYGDYSSTFSYNTMNNGSIIEMLEFLEVTNYNGSVGYNGLDNRYVLETLFGVKYYVLKDSDKKTPAYNFSYLKSYETRKYDGDKYGDRYIEFSDKEVENTSIYINNSAMSLGFVYDSYVTKESLLDMNGIERQDVLLENIVLDEEIEGVNKGTANTYVANKEFTLELSEGIEIKNNKIVVSEENAKLILKVSDLNNEELYVRISGIKNTNDKKKTMITYESSKNKTIEVINKPGTHMYVENSTQLENMGYYENADEETVEITFAYKGEYNYSDIEVYSYSMDSVSSKINSLKTNELKNIKIGTNIIEGEVETNKDGLLFLSIPYNEGFSAYVNGQKVEIYNANIGFMAIKINEGNSNVVLKYETNYLKEGSYVSLTGITILLMYIPIEVYLKKRKHIKEDF